MLGPDGAAIRDTKVTVLNGGTGLLRAGLTNEAGQYWFGALDPGTYELTVEASGFGRATVKEVVVNVGAAVQVNLTLAAEAFINHVDLPVPSSSVVESYPSQVITQVAIRDLPIDGRRFQDFAELTPTAYAGIETRGQLSFVGQRGINSNVMIDGTDYNEPFIGGIRGGERSIVAFTVPQSAIQEFQTVTAGYSAEYGRSTGGILNAITRSGSNALHGEAFYQIRHKEHAQENPLNQQSLETQHQFGAAVGGPVRKDRLFFFGAAEQQFAAFPRLVRFSALDSVAGSVTPDIAPAYNYFRSLETPFRQTNDVTAVLGRLDYQLSDGSRLTGRYNYSYNYAKNVVSLGTNLNPQTNSALSNNGTEKDKTHTAVAQWTSVMGPLLLNELRAQYSGEEFPRTANSESPNVDAGVIGNFGTRSFLPATTSDYRAQLADALTLLRGNHTFKLGLDYSYIGVSQKFGSNQFGTFVVSGSDVRSTLQILSRSGGPEGNRFDHPNVLYRRQVGNLELETHAHQLAFFMEDNWRVQRDFTINYGVRWEGQFNPKPAADNEFLLANVRDFNFPLGRVDPTFIRDQLNQWAPRLGVAWNLGGNHTVIRAQSGLFYAQTPLVLYAAPLDNFRLPGGDLTLQISPIGSNTVYQQFLAGGFDLNKTAIDRLPIYSVADIWMQVAGRPNPFANATVSTTSGNRFRNPRAFQVSFVLEHQLRNGLVLDYQYNHVNTVHLQRNVDYNLPLPYVRPGDLSFRPFFGLSSGQLRPNPNLSWVHVRDSSARSNFGGHTFRAQQRMKALQFAAHYTLSFNKSDDDGDRIVNSTYHQNPFDFSRDYNWSTLDARHQISGYAMYQAPWGIELSTLFRYRSGLPIDASTGEDTSELQVGNLTNRPLERPGVFFLAQRFPQSRLQDRRSQASQSLPAAGLRQASILGRNVQSF